MDDEKLYQMLRSSRPSERNKALEQLYIDNWNLLIPFIRRLGVKEEDAKDVFQDSLIVLYEKAQQGKLDLKKGSLGAFLRQICRYQAFSFTRKSHDKDKVDIDDPMHDVISDDFFTDILEREKREELARAMDKLSEICQQILRLFYFDRYDLATIAEVLGMKTPESAKTQKHRCMKGLRGYF